MKLRAGLKSYSPTTPGLRGTVLVDRRGLWRGRGEKTLCERIKSTGGRNAAGCVTARHRGGGARRLYRKIDFRLSKSLGSSVVERLEYDPGRTSFIALVKRHTGDLSYVLAPEGLKVGDKIDASEEADVRLGNSLPLSRIPQGTFVHNIELKPGKGGQLVRSAGGSARVLGLDASSVLLKLSSGEVRRVSDRCWATIGVLSNPNHKNISLGKAGRSRWMGRRSHVRGVAMNPIDHPHGGGEGKTSGGRHPVSPWGMLAKGKRSRNNKRTQKFIVHRRK